MVKNYGGGKQKKQGRKFINAASRSNKLRYAQEEGEFYGCVQKLLGNGMAHVLSLKGITWLCIIRNKFRGRGKRGNELKIGTLVLVGDREWESKSDTKINKCDLLQVYSDSESKTIQDNVHEDWKLFKTIENPHNKDNNTSTDSMMFEFGDDIDNEQEEQILNEISNNKNETTFVQDDEDFNIDDI